MVKKIIAVVNGMILCALCSCGTVYPACPVCALAVGGCVAFSKRFGIDDTIIGLWIGSLIASLIGMTVTLLNRMNIRFMGRKALVALSYLIIIIWPLYHKGYIGYPHNTLLGIDKMVLGIILGIIVFCIGCIVYSYLKQTNNGHAYFPFQKVVVPVGLLLVVSFIFYCITK